MNLLTQISTNLLFTGAFFLHLQATCPSGSICCISFGHVICQVSRCSWRICTLHLESYIYALCNDSRLSLRICIPYVVYSYAGFALVIDIFQQFPEIHVFPEFRIS